MISALAWVPRGGSKARPARFELGPEEYARIKELATQEATATSDKGELEHEGDEMSNDEKDVQADSITNTDMQNDFEGLPPELEMDKYDEDENIPSSIQLYADEEMDTILEENDDLFEIMDQGQGALALDADSEDDDAEDDEIRHTDAVLVVATTEDDFSHLEVHLYNTIDGNLYTHHDITLKEFPLCLAWMDIPPFLKSDNTQTEVGSYVAVGSFDPTIEIWNLDVLDPLEPSATLGGKDKTQIGKRNKKGKRRPVPLLPDSHTEAVMGLNWNSKYRNALASASADHTVKVWDVTVQACSLTLTHHHDKVQCVSWHPQEAWLMASASFDRTLALVDCRTSALLAPGLALEADPESLKWDPWQPFHVYSALENGSIVCVDVRNLSGPLFSFQAHENTVSALSFSPKVPGMLATASVDKTIRIWDVQTRSETLGDGAPHLVMYKTMNVGKLFALDFYPMPCINVPGSVRDEVRDDDIGYMLACGGDGGVVAIWESDEADAIQHYFGKKAVRSGEQSQEILDRDMSALRSNSTAIDTRPDASTESEVDKTKETSKKKKKKKKQAEK